MKKIIIPLSILALVVLCAGIYLVVKNHRSLPKVEIVSVACAEPMQEKELPSFLPSLTPNYYPLIPTAVVLTFDDGPYRYYGAAAESRPERRGGNSHSVEHTEIILDIIRKENIKATFFLLGIQLDTKVVSTGSTYPRYCEWVRRMFAEGHTVSVHEDQDRISGLSYLYPDAHPGNQRTGTVQVCPQSGRERFSPGRRLLLQERLQRGLLAYQCRAGPSRRAPGSAQALDGRTKSRQTGHYPDARPDRIRLSAGTGQLPEIKSDTGADVRGMGKGLWAAGRPAHCTLEPVRNEATYWLLSR
ncbi:MAG: polysaccharide deacetylase family protein [Planctomycetes bacterium]|nr:polysaccharide deacetylase family protein [Planctomycetota bacterium]